MERATQSRKALRNQCRRLQRGTSIVETVIALPILLVVILGAIQFALIYEAKATLNHASLQAARVGAVRNADPEAIRRGLASGLTALYSPESSLAGFARTSARIQADLATDARIRILNPMREAFDDFAVDVDGEREIPSDRLHARNTAFGARSGINIQDANLLKVQVTYGYELNVPLVNWFIARVLLGVTGAGDSFEQQLLRRTRLPIVATATVRMQSPARLSDIVVSRSDFPSLERIPIDASPPSSEDESEGEEGDSSEGGPSHSPDADAENGSGLDDGFFGFGEGEGSGGGGIGGGNPNDGGGSGGGVNGGNPQQCSIDDDPSNPFPFDDRLPGDSNPLPSSPNLPWLDGDGVGSGASLESISLASLSVGNPIHVVTGNKFQTETDIDALPGVLGLGFQRHYNSSAVNEPSVMGAGWRHSYQATLRQREDRIEIVQADGRSIAFQKRAATFAPQRASDGSLAASPEGFRWRWRSGRELIFEAAGRLVRMRARNGELTFRYDKDDQLTSVVDPRGRELRFEYYANGRLAAVRGPGGAGAAYGYDAAGNLVQVIGADGRARRYTYEDERHPHHLSSIAVGSVRPLAYGQRRSFERVASWAYDERGRAVFSSHPNDAGKVTLVFADGHTDVTDAFGRTTRYVTGWKDGIAYVSEVRGPGCGSCGQGDVRYAYDDRFQLLSVAHPSQTLHYRYDDRARLVQLDRGIGREREWVLRYAYEGSTDRVARVERPSVKADAVAVIDLTYSPNGEVVRVRESGFSPDGDAYRPIARETNVSYDGLGRVRRIDGPRTDADDWTAFEYDDFDRVIAIESPAGEKRMLAHDAGGRPTHIAESGRPALKLTYDARGRVTSVAHVRSRGKLEVRFSYDHAGRLTGITDAAGRSIQYGFDAAGRPNRLSSSDSHVQTVARYAPDARLERISAFATNGQLLRTLYYAYDSERRLIEVRDGTGQPLRQLAYANGDALPDRMIDPLGNEALFTYDARGRLTSKLAPDRGETRIEYDAFDRTTRVSAPNDAATAFLYDDFGRRVQERSVDRGETKYTYDAAGNLIEKTDARGASIRLTYDAANRLIEIARAEGVSKLSYKDGLLTHVDGELADERYEYDVDGQLVAHRRIIGGRAFTTRFEYDEHGRLTRRELPSGARLRYGYAANGVLQSITHERWRGDRSIVQSTSSSAAKLDAQNSLELGNGISLRTKLDAASSTLKSREIESVAALAYEHDEAGRIASIRRNGERREYRYDAANRLTSATTPRGTFKFAYDDNGNRLASSFAPSPASRGRAGEEARPTSTHLRYEYTPNSNRLLSIGGETRYDYDESGNPLTIGARRYVYDSTGRPTKLFDSGRLIAEYRYNFWGERVQKVSYVTGKRVVTSYLYEQQKLIAEADERGTITREYVYLDHHPVALLERGRWYWIHTDHLGTPIAVTDERRNVVWQADHDPFGEAAIEADPDGDDKPFTLNLRFPGQYADTESGTSYNYLRDYDPRTGRYLTADPIGIVGGTNLFAYAGSSPIIAFDLLGLYQEDIHYYMTLFLAVTAGVDPYTARRIALASAFVDVNAATRPADASNGLATGLSVLRNQPQLLLYHFVLSDPATGQTLEQYRNGNYHAVATSLSPQLATMLRYSTAPPHYISGSAPCDSEAASLQFFGEFLHSLADTYAHRGRDDRPYDAIEAGLGLGHAIGGHWPDYTYNEGAWITREARTFAMELDVRDAIRNSQWADPLRSTTDRQFETLVSILREFNAMREDEQSLQNASEGNVSELWLHSRKIASLNAGLRQLGYDSVDLTSAEFRFDEAEARRLREGAFEQLDRSQYPGAILETRP